MGSQIKTVNHDICFSIVSSILEFRPGIEPGKTGFAVQRITILPTEHMFILAGVEGI